MFRATTPVDRWIAAPVVLATILTQLVIVYLAYGAAWLEFHRTLDRRA